MPRHRVLPDRADRGCALGRLHAGRQVSWRLAPVGAHRCGGVDPGFLFQALAILSAAGFPGLGWPRWTGWAAFAAQVASTVFNWITPSKLERAVWGPVTLVMSAMAVVVMTA
ncbi:hypothetical protein [Marivita lacus]|uniref:hypothetical protein n=1 Tax=Marivita lacus TaxID=1323742 RepID=UPI001E59B44A|nr:hypothetical protein [Marivita lacus]